MSMKLNRTSTERYTSKFYLLRLFNESLKLMFTFLCKHTIFNETLLISISTSCPLTFVPDCTLCVLCFESFVRSELVCVLFERKRSRRLGPGNPFHIAALRCDHPKS